MDESKEVIVDVTAQTDENASVLVKSLQEEKSPLKYHTTVPKNVGVVSTDFPYEKHLKKDPVHNRLNYAQRMNFFLNRTPSANGASRSMVRTFHAQNPYQSTAGPQLESFYREQEKRRTSMAPVSDQPSVSNEGDCSHEQQHRRRPKSQMGWKVAETVQPSIMFRATGRTQKVQMNAYLSRADEGAYHSLMYKSGRENTLLFDQQDQSFNRAKSQLDAENISIPLKVEDIAAAYDPKNENIVKGYYKNRKQAQNERQQTFNKYKEIMQQGHSLKRRDQIISRIHPTGLVGNESPEKQSCSKVYKDQQHKLQQKTQSHWNAIEYKKSLQTRVGGTSAQLHFCHPKKGLNGRKRDPVVEIGSTAAPWNKKVRSNVPFERKYHTGRDDVKALIKGYQNSPASIRYPGRYSDPPNFEQISPNPHKRCVKEQRNFNLINGQIPLANKFIT